MQYENKIFKISVGSRFLLIFIQYVSNHLFPDHEPDVFMYPEDKGSTFIDYYIHEILGGFLRWDAQYFMHIAKFGYTYENTMAFFPLFPITVRLISFILHRFIPFVTFDSILLLVFVCLNFVLFILATRNLYNLTKLLFNENIAYKSCVLFCFNPASVFFIAPYTECLFCYLSFKSMLNCLLLYKKSLESNYQIHLSNLFFLIPICLSTITRSNGLLNIGFLVYMYICLFVNQITSKDVRRKIKYIFKYFLLISVSCAICIFPFVLYQSYCYYMFCTSFELKFTDVISDHAKMYNFILPGSFYKHNQPWCHRSVPLAYSYVQDHYWNVGFLRYYTLKQVPNFLLSFPILFIILSNCYRYLKVNFRGNIIHLFTFNKIKQKKQQQAVLIFGQTIYVFVIHALFLSTFCLLFIHVQVSTRMLCSSTPYFYWISSYILKNADLQKDSYIGKLLKLYYIGYFVVGTAIFSNFLPWT